MEVCSHVPHDIASNLDMFPEIGILPHQFYTRETLTVARELLGKYLVRYIEGNKLIGKIIEVEAYGGRDDPASYAYKKMTPKNQFMFEEGGCVFVCFVYGKNYSLNITTNKKNIPGAVLVRAVEPIVGINIMQRNRGISGIVDLTNGPGKLTQAFRITNKQNGLDLSRNKEMFIINPKASETFEIISTNRVGIKMGVEKPWRFCIKDY